MNILKNEQFIKQLNEYLIIIDDIMVNINGIFKGFQINEETGIPLVMFNDPKTATTLALPMDEFSEETDERAIMESRKVFEARHL